MPTKQVFNPFLPLSEYIPDGEPHVFEGRIYLFGSRDKEGGETFCMLDYQAWSAPETDLSDWRNEGTIYSARQDPRFTEERPFLYAPDVVRGNDGRFYLYYCLSGTAGKGGYDGPISVAVGSSPGGKYQYWGYVRNPDGSPLSRFVPFDPAVINDGGTIRLYYGTSFPFDRYENFLTRRLFRSIQSRIFHKTPQEVAGESEGVMGANMAVLADDMLTVTAGPVRIIPNRTRKTSFESHPFFEAASMRKIGETYYFIYSSFQNHELCYATSRYPDRGFAYGGVILSNGDIGLKGRTKKNRLNTTGTNHGSLEVINGRWYVFYHRLTHNSGYSRQACAEPVTIRMDGSIRQVEITSCGLNGKPLAASGTYPAAIACVITNGHMPHLTNSIGRQKVPHVSSGNGERFITGIRRRTVIGFRYFEFTGPVAFVVQTRGGGKGRFKLSSETGVLGEVSVGPSESWKESRGVISERGTKTLFLTWQGGGEVQLLSVSFQAPSGSGS